MSNILVTGSKSGLGLAIAEHLRAGGHLVFDWDKSDGFDVRAPWQAHPRWQGTIDVLINCAGVNRIDWLEKFSVEEWNEVMDTNAKGIYMMSRTFLPQLKESRGTILNIISNASHMPMTCSLAYNASKAAAHMMTLQMARELAKDGITVFGISPNKLFGTGMSKDIEKQVCYTREWTPEYAAEYQRKALLTGFETPPERVAEFIAFLLSSKDRHECLTGCVIPYGA